MREFLSLYDAKIESLDMVKGYKTPQTPMELMEIVFDLAVHSYKDLYGKDYPPPYLFHVSQVDTGSGAMLVYQPSDVQRRAKMYAWSHDMGRALDMGRRHSILGARMIESLGMDNHYVRFAAAHHRWGQGLTAYGNDFPMLVDDATQSHNWDSVYRRLDITPLGIESLVVLLADNSKVLRTSGSFEPSIVPYSQALGDELIQDQIKRGRYWEGSYQHHVDQRGAIFLANIIPYLENRLEINYMATIEQAQERWPGQRREIVTLWNRFVYES